MKRRFLYKSIILAATLTLTTSNVFAFNWKPKEETIGTAERPAKVKLPKSYRSDKSYPLVLMLHGRGNNSTITDLYLGLSRSQNKLDYVLILPNGTIRSDGQRIWNATEECCDTDNTGVDDTGYLLNLVEETKAKFNIDPEQVFIMGHSNGGFMAYRLACDTNGIFKGIVSIAGSTFASEESCQTTTPINVLQIHGTDDSTVPFDGKGKKYPAAFETAERWATRNSCASFTESPKSQNLIFFAADPKLDENGNPSVEDPFKLNFGPETDEFKWQDCADDTQVALWKVNGSDHAPVFLGKDMVRKALEFVGFQTN